MNTTRHDVTNDKTHDIISQTTTFEPFIDYYFQQDGGLSPSILSLKETRRQ